MEEERIKPTPDGLLKWALSNSKEGEKIDQNKLMTPEELKEFWKEAFPDEIQLLKDNLEVLKKKEGTSDEIYYSLDKVLFIVEGIDQADWFADLNGFEIVEPYLFDEDSECRMAAAWIFSNSLQNNPKVQKKFLEKIGLKKSLESIMNETVEKPLLKKFTLISSAIRSFLPLRIQFYELNGLNILINLLNKFSKLNYRFTWLIGAILDEEQQFDKEIFQKFDIKNILLNNSKEIDDDEILNNVLSRI